MPRVPYQPFSTVTPQSPGEGLSVSTPPAAFGENVAHAVEQLGTTTEQVGNELFGRAIALQDLRNETDARDADSNYIMDQGTLREQFNSLEGQAKADAFPTYIAQSKALRQSYRDKLTNPMAQKYFDSTSLNFMARNIFSAAGEAGSANKEAIDSSAKANMALTSKTFANPQDETEFQSKLSHLETSLQTLAGVHNWSQAQYDEAHLSAVSSLRMGQIIQQAHIDPTKAIATLEAHKSEMTQPDYDRTAITVQAQNRSIGGTNLANSVYSPDKSLSQMEQEVKAASPELAHGDPLFEKDAITALRTKYNQTRYAQRQDTVTAQQNIFEAIAAMPPGQESVQRLRADPKIAAIIDSLPPDMKNKVPSWINTYVNSRDKLDNDRNWTTLYGLAKTDPEKFLNIQPNDPLMNISSSQMRGFYALRKQAMETPGGDPRLNRALTWMKGAYAPELRALGVYDKPRSGDDTTEYDHYTGALGIAIDEFTTANGGKSPTFEDIRDKIGKQVIQQRTVPHQRFFGLLPGSTPFFDPQITNEYAAGVRNAAQQEGYEPPSDDEIFRAYMRQQFQDLYAKPKSK